MEFSASESKGKKEPAKKATKSCTRLVHCHILRVREHRMDDRSCPGVHGGLLTRLALVYDSGIDGGARKVHRYGLTDLGGKSSEDSFTRSKQ